MIEISDQDKAIMGLLTGNELSDQEISESKRNLLGFFNVLYRIDLRLKKEAARNEVGRD